MIISQISVFLENRVGQLTEITSCLAAAGIDLRAINIAEAADYGVVRMITDDNETAASVLKEKGFILSSTPVVVVRVPDEVGGLAKLVRTLSAADIDIEYMYSIFSRHANLASMIFRVADPETMEVVLKNSGFDAYTADDPRL